MLRLRYTEYTHSIILHEPQANAKSKSHLTPRLTRTGVEPCVEAVLNLKPDISHLQAAPKHTRTSRVSPYMHQDPIWFTTCTNIGFLPPRLRCRKATMHPSAVVQNLQTQMSPFQSILRAKDRVERCTKRIAYLFSPHSASFRG